MQAVLHVEPEELRSNRIFRRELCLFAKWERSTCSERGSALEDLTERRLT